MKKSQAASVACAAALLGMAVACSTGAHGSNDEPSSGGPSSSSSQGEAGSDSMGSGSVLLPNGALIGPLVDRFGITMIHPTLPGGHTWFARWDIPRNIPAATIDPVDPEFQNRGDGTFDVAGDGTATATGMVDRHYIYDHTGGKQWHNIELTFYAMRVSETAAQTYSGFVTEVRTGDGHVEDPARQCLGASYAIAMYYDGRAELKKEAKHPIYSTVKNPSVPIWPLDGPLPYHTWVGFKATVRDLPNENAVEMILYRDLTDGQNGGKWENVLTYVDRGGWAVGNGSPICGLPADRIMTGPHPVIIIRNDGATTQYKKLSVREIDY